MEKLEDELYQKNVGYTTALEITPGGNRNGLDYGPKVCEIVRLDEHDLAYRYSDDSINCRWALGTAEDVVLLMQTTREMNA